MSRASELACVDWDSLRPILESLLARLSRRTEKADRSGTPAAGSPLVLLLDEPDNHLDMPGKATLKN